VPLGSLGMRALAFEAPALKGEEILKGRGRARLPGSVAPRSNPTQAAAVCPGLGPINLRAPRDRHP
jgi:hypothetical protein